MKKLRHKCKVTLSLFVTMLLVIGSVTASLATDENSSAKAYSATLTEDQITLTLNAVVNGDLPDDTKLTVKKVTSNESEYKGLEKKLSNQATEDHYINNGSSIYDYAFVSENKEVTPTGDVTLTMTYSQAYAPSGATNEDEVSLFKLSSPVVNLAKDTKTKITTANQSNKVTQISYTTNSLDPIALVYREKKQSVSKVNVHYVNAKDTSKELADVKTISGSELSGEMSLDNLSKALVNTDNYTYTYQKAALDKANGTTIQGLKADKKDDVTKLYYITSGSKDYTTYKGEGESYEVNIYLLYDVTEKVKEDTSKKEETSETKVAEEASKSESTTSKTKATEETQKSTVSENNKKTEEQKVEMPAASFTASTSKLKISVTASENTFPKGTTMKAKEISASTAKSIAKEKMKDVKNAIGADITFYYQGKEIEPANNKNVTVKMEPKNTLDEKHFNVLHKKDSGEVEKIDAEVKDKKFVFKAKSFSIYIIGEKTVYTYKFHKDSTANSNVIEEYTQKITNGDKLDQPKAPEKEGYKFIGWATTPNATKADITDDYFSNPIDTTKITTEDANNVVNIYPVFQEVHYVFFMAGNDEEKYKDNVTKVAYTMEGTKDRRISLSDISNKVKLGLSSTESIEGWYEDSALKNKVTDYIVIGDQNIRLYPKIVEGHYIYFNSGEDADYIEPEFVAGGTSTKVPTTPKRVGYKFKCWSTEENGSEYTFGETISEDVTLYAVWTPQTVKYTVIYWWENANDDNYSFHESIEKWDKSGTTIDANNFKTYDGFNLNNEKTKSANSNVKIAGDGSTIINVYYKRNIYSIYFLEYKWVQTGWYWDDGGYKWSNIDNLTITAKYGENIAKKWPSRISPIWPSNWFTGKSDSNGKIYQSGISTMPLNGASFYYEKQEGDYTINTKYMLQNLNNDEYTLDHTDSFKSNKNSWWTVKEDHYDIEGFTYKNNVKDGTKYKQVRRGVYEISFQYLRNSYKINFINGNIATSQTFKYEADISGVDLETAPTRPSGVLDNYIFKGWYDNELRVGDPVKLSGHMPAHNITLYAKWVAPVVGVTVHDLDDSNTQTISDISYRSKVDVSKLPTVRDSDNKVIEEGNDIYTYTVPKGSHWIGWATKDENDNYTVYNFNTELTTNLDLYPYVIDSNKYIVKYNADKGTLKANTSITDDKSYTYNSYSDVKSAENINPPEGYMFLNWRVYTVDNLEKDTATNKYVYPGDKLKMTSNMKLVAQYVPTPKKVKLVYYSKPYSEENNEEVMKTDAVVNNGKITLANGSEILKDKMPVIDGINVEFDEWTTKDGNQTFTSGKEVGINKINCKLEKDDDNKEYYINRLYPKYKYTLSLTITKHVTGNQGDRTKAFEFAVNVGNIQSNTTVTLDKSHAKSDENPESLTASDGTVNRTITLKNDDSITLKFESNKCQDIQKLYCSVEETNSSTYDASYTVDEENSITGNKVVFTSLQKSHAIVFTNDKNGSIPTGIEKNVVITLPLIISGIGFVLMMLKKRNEVE